MVLENGVLILGSTPNRSLEAATSMEQVLRTAGGREEVGERGDKWSGLRGSALYLSKEVIGSPVVRDEGTPPGRALGR